jgi:hypothetical protein
MAAFSVHIVAAVQYYLDIHSYGELILYPWGDDNNQDIDPNQNFRNPAYHGLRGASGATGSSCRRQISSGW